MNQSSRVALLALPLLAAGAAFVYIHNPPEPTKFEATHNLAFPAQQILPEPRFAIELASTPSNAATHEDYASKLGRLTALARSNFAESKRQVYQSFSPADRGPFLEKIIFKLCAEDLSRLNSLAGEVTDVNRKRSLVGSIAAHWAQEDPYLLSRFARENLTGVLQNEVLFEATSGLAARSDFTSAASLISELPFSSERLNSIGVLAERWAVLDPISALKWVEGLPLPEDKLKALPNIIAAAGSGADTSTLIAILNSTEDDHLRQQAVQEIVNNLDFSEEASLKWVDSLQPSLRSAGTKEFLRAAPLKDLAGLTKQALSLQDKSDRSEAAMILVDKISTSNPLASAEWSSGLPDDIREATLSLAVSKWYDVDSERLSTWIDTLQAGVIRDQALTTLAYRLKDSDISSAREVASKISNKSTRQAIVGTMR